MELKMLCVCVVKPLRWVTTKQNHLFLEIFPNCQDLTRHYLNVFVIFFYLYIYLSIYISVYLSIYLSIYSGKGRTLKLPQLIDMGAQVAAGMAYLESQNYIHRDLAARLVMLKNLAVRLRKVRYVSYMSKHRGGGSTRIALP